MLFGLLLCAMAQAETVIHKCVDADGNVEYTDAPCPEPKPADTQEEADEPEPSEFVWERRPVMYARSADDIEACKENYRDQIDAIEAEILAEYSPEEGPEYKSRLLKLTSAMRACEQG